MSIRFDTSTDRITWTGTAPTPSSGITILFWAYVSTDLNANSTYMRLHTSSGGTTVVTLATNTDGTTPSCFTVGGTVVGPTNPGAATWARVAYTITGTTAKVYTALTDTGATNSTTGTAGSSASTAPLSGYTVGGRSSSDASERFDGRIAYLRVWSTVLTQSEIETEWMSATPVRTSLLFADYPLETASDLTDHSGNGRHLSAGTSPVTSEADPPLPAPITGTLAATLPSLTTSMAGQIPIDATVAATLPALDATFVGHIPIDAVVQADLPALESSLTGGVTVGGTLAADLPPLEATVAGGVLVGGTLDATLPGLDASATGTLTADGTLAAELPAIETDMDGVLGTGPGTLIAALPPLGAAFAGGVQVAGALDATLPALGAFLAGPDEGLLAADLPALTLVLDGDVSVPITGELAADLPALTAALGGDVSVPILGQLAVTLPALAWTAPQEFTWPPDVQKSEAVEFVAVS